MKFLLILISVSPIVSLYNIFSKSKKICTNCKHFIKSEDLTRYGKCSLFPILNAVDDEDDDIKQYLDCIQSRNNNYMCGKKGRFFEKIVHVDYPPFLSLVEPSFFDEISEFDFEQYIQFL